MEPVLLNIDSRDMTYQSSNGVFSITLVRPLYSVKKMAILDVEIPFSYYVINALNNNMRVVENLTNTIDFNITPGNYTIQQLASRIQLILNTVSPMGYTYTVAPDVNTGKITISVASGTINLIFNPSTYPNNLGNILGYGQTNTGNGSSHTAPHTYNVTGDNYIFVRSTTLTAGGSANYANSATSNVILKVPVNVEPFELIQYNLFDDIFYQNYGYNKNIDRIDLQLTDYYGNNLDLNGQSWSITLLFYL